MAELLILLFLYAGFDAWGFHLPETTAAVAEDGLTASAQEDGTPPPPPPIP